MKTWLALVALLLIGAGTALAAESPEKAAKEPEEITLAGKLKVSRNKKNGKTTTAVYLLGNNKRTYIKLKLAKGDKKPDIKELVNKNVEVVGLGTTKVVGKKATVTFTKISRFEAVEKTEEPKTDEE